MGLVQEFTKGLYRENPVFRLALGLCPTLAVTTTVKNGVGMGLAATSVLLCSNIIISAIKNTVPKKIHLPLTPKVVSRDNSLFICFKDGSEIYWGDENSTIEALDLARELEIELRAVSYLKQQISDFVKDMEELLFSINADESLLLSIIKDGHIQAFNGIGQDTCKKLLLDRKPMLKDQIIEKITSFIV